MEDVYVIPAHTFDDDGFEARCLAGDQYCTPNRTNGQVLCPECGATLAAILVAG